jgi:hypothetical protein
LRKQKPSSNSRPQDGTDEKYESLAGTKQKKHFEFTNDGNLNPTQFEEVTKMLEQQIKLFDVKDRNPVVSNVRHEIDTENSKPVHCQPKQIGFKERDYIKQQVTEMIARDENQESNSPWSSRIVLAKKKDCKSRFC